MAFLHDLKDLTRRLDQTRHLLALALKKRETEWLAHEWHS